MPQDFRKTENVCHQLRKSGLSFIGYSGSLPRTGLGVYIGPLRPASTTHGSTSARCRQAPIGHSATSRADYHKLPTVSFVSPNMCHSMHDCSIRTGDRWMKKHFDRYARWATRHNSWLIVTFDENAGGRVKPIAAYRELTSPIWEAEIDDGTARATSAMSIPELKEAILVTSASTRDPSPTT